MQDGQIEIVTLDDTRIAAHYRSPLAKNQGALILVQEIFGVNEHIRHVADQYAHLGFHVLAPSFFDRVQPGVEFDYSPEGFAEGRRIAAELGFDQALRDVRAAERMLSHFGPVGVVGYCWGGSVAYLAATRLGLPSVAYYGSRIPQFLHERPQAPLMFHFGERDTAIPLAQVQQIRAHCDQAECHVYHAGHGFNRRGHADFHAVSAELALHRTLGFFSRHMLCPS